MNKNQFVSELMVETGLDSNQINSVLSAIRKVTGDALAANDTVSIYGIGTFERKDKPEREGFNNLTKKPFHTPASTTVVLKPSKKLLDKINGIESDDSDEE